MGGIEGWWALFKYRAAGVRRGAGGWGEGWRVVGLRLEAGVKAILPP